MSNHPEISVSTFWEIRTTTSHFAVPSYHHRTSLEKSAFFRELRGYVSCLCSFAQANSRGRSVEGTGAGNCSRWAFEPLHRTCPRHTLCAFAFTINCPDVSTDHDHESTMFLLFRDTVHIAESDFLGIGCNDGRLVKLNCRNHWPHSATPVEPTTVPDKLPSSHYLYRLNQMCYLTNLQCSLPMN